MLQDRIALANADIRQAMLPDNPARIAAIRAQELDRAQVLVSRKVGWRVCVGDIQVKLKHNRI